MEIRKYKCADCRKIWEYKSEEYFFIEDDDVIEIGCVFKTPELIENSDIYGDIYTTYCPDCDKTIKIYAYKPLYEAHLRYYNNIKRICSKLRIEYATDTELLSYIDVVDEIQESTDETSFNNKIEELRKHSIDSLYKLSYEDTTSLLFILNKEYTPFKTKESYFTDNKHKYVDKEEGMRIVKERISGKNSVIGFYDDFIDTNTINCPLCNKEISKELDYDSCPKCNGVLNIIQLSCLD